MNPRRAFFLGMMTSLALPQQELDDETVRRLGHLPDKEATTMMIELMCYLLDHPMQKGPDGARRVARKKEHFTRKKALTSTQVGCT